MEWTPGVGLAANVVSSLPLLASTLVELLLKSVVILGLAACASVVSFRASAAFRHLVWTVGVASALALLFVAPALRYAGAAWRNPLPFGMHSPAWLGTPRTGAAALGAQAPVTMPGRTSPASGNANRTAEGVGDSETREPETFPAAAWIVGVWGLGALLVFVRVAVGFIGLTELRRRGAVPDGGAWLETRDALCEAYRLSRRPRLLVSRSAATPMAWGLASPTIMLPDGSSRWPRAQCHMVLAHELAHVKRHDVFWNLIARLSCAVYWPNPLVWLAARRLRVEAEFACDDVVLNTGAKRADYGECLVEAARLFCEQKRRSIAAIGMASSSRLEGRLRAILDWNRRRSSVGRAALTAAFGVGLAAAIPVAAFEAASAPRVAAREATLGISDAADSRHCELDRWPTASTMDPVATRQALALFRSDSGKDRSDAVARLGNLGTSEAVPDLIEALNDPDGQLRSAAASALGHIGDPRAVEPLLGSLTDSDKHVQQAAIGALGALGDNVATLPLAGLLQSSVPQIRQSAASALGDAGDHRAVGPLLEALADPNEHVRQSAALSLGRLGAEQAKSSLAGLLDDENAHVRAAAIRALGQLGAREYAERLATIYDQSPDQFVLLDAARALGQLGDFRGLGLLVATLRVEPEQFVRRDAAWAIAATSEELRRRLEEDARDVEAALRDALRDRSRYVRHAAACAMEKLTGTHAESSQRRLDRGSRRSPE